MFISAPGLSSTFSSYPAALAGAATAPAEQGGIPAWQVIAFVILFVLALGLAAGLGVFQPRRVDGPLRVAADRPLWPMAAAIGIALMLWFGSEVFYFAVKQLAHPQPQGSTGVQAPPASKPVNTEKPPPQTSPQTAPETSPQTTVVDFAVMSTVPGLVAFIFLFATDRRLSATLQLQLGFTRRRFFDGAAKGLLASVMIMPAMFVGMIVLELIYERAGYQHPGEHALLRVMDEAKNPILRGLLISGAVLTAPFFEEYLFRGYLQTFLRQVLVNWSMLWQRPPAGPALVLPAAPELPAAAEPRAAGGVGGGEVAPAPAAKAAPAPPPPPGAPPIPYFALPASAGPPPAGKRVWQTWLAILITSFLFASVHEAWSRPLIFVLAVFLGYAYERTGSLWTTITIHLVFNTTETIVFFLSQRS